MAAAVEVCVESAAGALAAEAGGASRVELCADRSVGGLTPDPAETARACGALSIPVHVLIRPRAGDFLYSPPEFEAMGRQVAEARRLGASGVVLGLLHPDGSVDRGRTAALIARARPAVVTFHKAFDVTPDPFAALDVLIGLGVERVLTSGHAPTAREGLARLAGLVRHARWRIVIMAGGAVTEADLPALRAAGVDEVHSGSSVAPGGTTDPDRVRELVAAWSRLF
jgi:copper homeostasis protein